MKEKIVSLVRSLKRVPRILREILYGKAVHEMDLELKKKRVLFDEVYTRYHPLHRKTDRFRFDGYLVSMRERVWKMN